MPLHSLVPPRFEIGPKIDIRPLLFSWAEFQPLEVNVGQLMDSYPYPTTT
jgi:hypothetical protein